MADNGGVKSAYTAFSNLKSDIDQKQFPGLDYTPEQLFFMGFGQVSIHFSLTFSKAT